MSSVSRSASERSGHRPACGGDVGVGFVETLTLQREQCLSSGINLQDKGVRPMGLRPSNIGTLEAAEVFDPFPESHRLGK